MEVKNINEKSAWESFLLGCEEKTFLQSWNWGEFNKMMGNKIWRLGVFEGNKLISVALVIKIQAKRGIFLLCPHGPSLIPKIKIQKSKVSEALLEELKKIGEQEKIDSIRVSPVWQRNKENIKIFKDMGFRLAPIHVHPELTWELNITSSEEEILMNMRKTTRYLIRRAEKDEQIKIYQSKNAEDIEIFNKLYREIVGRHHFIPFSLNYLKNEFLAFQKDNQISLFLGKYKNEIISSGFFIFWQNIVFYHHGASSLKYPKVPVSYLSLWEAIREGKRRGCKTFNFWGIAPITEDLKKHPWAGLTSFKIGFGGEKKEYVKTQDFPLSWKYWLTFLFEKIRRKKRGL